MLLTRLQVENPIPFSDSSLERKLTTGYLHARYFELLLAPIHVSVPKSLHQLPVRKMLGAVLVSIRCKEPNASVHK